MAVVPALKWLNQRELGHLDCRVERSFEPGEYAVQLSLNGDSVTVIVPTSSVNVSGSLPADGTLGVWLIAELPESDPFYPGLLAELPAAPLNGTQRVKIKRAWLKDAPV